MVSEIMLRERLEEGKGFGYPGVVPGTKQVEQQAAGDGQREPGLRARLVLTESGVGEVSGQQSDPRLDHCFHEPLRPWPAK